jgi:peptidoglycan hydrolase-like protein with peptidoglycan-binding domain
MAKQMKKKNFCFSAKQLNPKIASTDDVYKLQSLLGRYGYLRGAYYPGSYDEATRNAVSQFQSFYHIYPEDDGVCDQQTIDLLNTPRAEYTTLQHVRSFTRSEIRYWPSCSICNSRSKMAKKFT